jgi:hypothetical protein
MNTMVIKRFSRPGLERLKNLSDVPSPNQAVTNILQGIKADITVPFTHEDLTPITGLAANGLPEGTIQKLSGAAPVQTVFDPNTNTGSVEVIQPVITIQESFNRTSQSQGEFPDFYAGEGPRASYYEVNQIDVTLPVVFQGNAQAQDQLSINGVNSWNNGVFTWRDQLHPNLSGLLGGVLFDGYLQVPNVDSNIFQITTNAFYVLELDSQNTGSLTVLREFKSFTRSVNVVGGLAGSDQISLDDSVVRLFVGDQFLDHATIPAGATVTGVNLTNKTASIDTLLPNTITVPASASITRTDTVSTSDTPPVLISEFTPTLWRLQVWWNQLIQTNIQKALTLRYRGTLNYKYLYPLDYSFTPASPLKQVFDSGVKLFGGTLGSPTNPAAYRNFKSLQRLNITYTPPTQLVHITQTASMLASSPRLTTSTLSVQRGFFLFSETPGFPNGAQAQIVDSRTVILDRPATSSASSFTFTAVDNKGFLAAFLATGTAESFTLQLTQSQVSAAWQGHLILSTQSGLPTYSVISQVDTQSNTVTINKALTQSVNARFYVYYSSGLVDLSLKQFCPSAPQSVYCVTNPSLNLPFDSTTQGLSTSNTVELMTPGASITWNSLNVNISDGALSPQNATDKMVSHQMSFHHMGSEYRMLGKKLN